MDIARSCRERALLVARERRIAWRIPYLTLRFAGLLVTIGDYQHARDLFVEANTYDTETPVLRVLRATVGIELARALDDSDLLKRLADERTLELAFQSQEPQRIAPLVAAYAKSRLAAGTPRGVRSLIARGLAAVTQADQAGELLSLAAQYASPKDALRAREVLLDRLRLPNHRTAEAYLELWNAYAARRRKAAGALHAHAERAAELFGKLGWHQHRDEALALTGKVRQNQTGAATQRPAILSDPSLRLTDREQQVTELVLRGMTNRAIAQTLGISEHTVETHMTSILSRLGLRSRWQLRDLN
jgi:DNA-binding CsgD family transcriptional regulator